MYLLTSKAVKDCTDDEIKAHCIEIQAILDKLDKLENFQCAVIEKAQDPAHSKEVEKIWPSAIHELKDILDAADLKNGCDLVTNDDCEFLVIVTYGQTYEYQGKDGQCITAYEILPFNSRRQFLDVITYLRGGEVKIAMEQFTNKHGLLN